MFMSLTSRLAAVGILVVVALLLLVAAMDDAAGESRASFGLVTRSSQVIQTMEESLAGLRTAESGQRGFIMTRKPGFAQSFDRQIEQARHSYSQLVELTKDNPEQNQRIQDFGILMEERIELMRGPLDLARQNAFEEAAAAVGEGRGYESMLTLMLVAQEFLNEERSLQNQRIAAAERRLAWGRTLAVVGGPIIALLALMVSVMVIHGIRQPIRVLTRAMTRLGQGDLKERITQRMGSREFSRLAAGYNTMAEQLETASLAQRRSEAELKTIHAELVTQSQVLRSRGEVIELLGAMAHRMQATRTDEELAEIISIFVPRVLPDHAGALYAYNNSRNQLVCMSVWGDFQQHDRSFAPNECWALRRGQCHYVSGEGQDVHCDHVQDRTAIYHCEPLLAAGEVIGVLHLEGNLDEEEQFRMGVLSENIASAMVNRRLQRDLKEQTIRDPLTSLFNRRYMEEALAMEIARASRSGDPLCVVMCDVDHFKRFNDEQGHDAGDEVLRLVARTLLEHFRDGDIVCRYGGEEFTIIAPGTTQEDLIRRTEDVRHAVSQLKPELGGRALGPVTLSFGVAQWREDMDKGGLALVNSADEALYQAKHQGRDRIVGHRPEEA